jgi:YVTN family beta-propeller protein
MHTSIALACLYHPKKSDMNALRAYTLLLSVGLSLGAHAGQAPYSVVQRLSTGGDDRWDYPSVDSNTHLLYLSRADHVSIVDIASGKEIASIADTPGVHGVALAPELNRGFISCGKADVVKVFDLKTRDILATVSTAAGPDSIVYEPITQRVIAMNGHGQSATVIDAKTNTVLATIPLGGKPEFARADGRGFVLLNIEDTGELAVIDTKALKLSKRWHLPKCEEPSGLAFDSVHRRSFSTCDNQVLAVFNIDSGKLIANIPIGKNVDGAEFDPATQNVFTANGEGTITVVHEKSPKKFVVQQTLTTQHGARTIALDNETHRLYLPTADFGPLPAATAEQPRPRAPILSGTFVVLVVDQATQ